MEAAKDEMQYGGGACGQDEDVAPAIKQKPEPVARGPSDNQRIIMALDRIAFAFERIANYMQPPAQPPDITDPLPEPKKGKKKPKGKKRK